MVTAPNVMSGIVNGLLTVKPIANFAKQKARQMMIERAELIGVSWHGQVAELRAQALETLKQQIEDPDLTYPDYYLRPFHAYGEGNLNWEAATEVEVAAYAVHSKVWGKEVNPQGDALLRQSYHTLLQNHLPYPPQTILDLGCSVGMSTMALANLYPHAQITGLDLSPYFLAIASHKLSRDYPNIKLLHSPAESTNLPSHAFDLISMFLVCHELPQSATIAVLQEAKRLLRPQGHLAIMDMNPQSPIYATMPPYILTLLKSTEPYLDEYFTLDLPKALESAGFSDVSCHANSPRHRTIIAKT